MASEIEYGKLAKAVYGGPGKTSVPTEMQAEWEILPEKLYTDNGYYGQAFRNKTTNEIVVASRGSRTPGDEGSCTDWIESDLVGIGGGNLNKLLGMKPNIPGTFKDARELAAAVKGKYPGAKITLTGHSKGAAEAEFAAGVLDRGMGAVTFASPGAAFVLSPKQIAAARPFIRNYSLTGDWVPTVGRHVGSDALLDPTMSQAVKSAVFNILLPAALGPLGWLVGKILDAAFIHPMANYLGAMMQNPAFGGGPLQARVTDMHVCPMVTGLVPHVGGPITAGCPTVFVGMLAAARILDAATCAGPPDAIAKGSATVFIGGMSAARLGDMTAHGGVITTGMPTVFTGG